MFIQFYKLFLFSFISMVFGVSLAQASPLQTHILFLTEEKPVPAALSNLDPFIQGKGLHGAELGVEDNNITGRFTGQKYDLKTAIVPIGTDIVLFLKQQLRPDTNYLVLNVSKQNLLQLADLPELQDKLLFDAGTIDDSLRQQQCRANVLHVLPSRAMRADALAQYMMKKRWRKWFLVVGPSEADELFAAAIKRSAKRFGMKIVAEKDWEHTYDARRTAQSDVPVFTQGLDYDVLVVADEKGLFGEYLDYRTWIPRPVIGTQGLQATSWHRTHEQWGAVQMQNRFKEEAGRWKEEQDYAAFLAVRSIGEATVRTNSVDVHKVKHYLLSDEFDLQGYKGRPLSYRAWNGQLRQPVLLAAPRSLVTAAPLEGFLHPITDLDTLGYDRQESLCQKHSQQ